MTDLLPCPFCGTDPALISEGDYHSVACPHYYCNFSQIALRSEKKAIDRWNTRSVPAQTQRTVSQEALDWAASESEKVEAYKAANPDWQNQTRPAREVLAQRAPDEESIKLADEMQSLGYPEFGDCLSLKAYNLILKALRASLLTSNNTPAAQQTLPPHVEKTEAGIINWKMEVERLNRLLVAAEQWNRLRAEDIINLGQQVGRLEVALKASRLVLVERGLSLESRIIGVVDTALSSTPGQAIEKTGDGAS